MFFSSYREYCSGSWKIALLTSIWIAMVYKDDPITNASLMMSKLSSSSLKNCFNISTSWDYTSSNTNFSWRKWVNYTFNFAHKNVTTFARIQSLLPFIWKKYLLKVHKLPTKFFLTVIWFQWNIKSGHGPNKSLIFTSFMVEKFEK